jgi:predicted ferric reductase
MKDRVFYLNKEKKRQKITLILILISYLPFLFLSSPPEFNSSDIIFYLARQTGYLAATLILWQIILGNRSITKYWLKDQVWIINLHKKIGIYGIVLILAHPLLIALDYADFSLIYTPDLTTEFGKAVALGRIALVLFLFIWITSAVLRSKIGFRPWKYIHFLAYFILVAVFLHAPKLGTFYAGSEIIELVWNMMIFIFVTSLAIRFIHFIGLDQKKFVLIEKSIIAEDVYRFTLKPDNKHLKVHPGQFVYLRTGIISEEHPFSVAGYTSDGNIQIASKVIGKYTQKLSKLALGKELYVDGPYGVFTHEVSINRETPVTFIAGGIGITPFLPHIINKTNKNITLFYANRKEKNIVMNETLKSVLRQNYVQVISDENNKKYRNGFITSQLIKDHLGDKFKLQEFYICGPKPMMKVIKKSLIESGIDKKRIHTEEFGY